ncbi:MAG TPA: hypothetical protein VGF86_14735 [Candidatus Tumulicola sp.]
MHLPHGREAIASGALGVVWLLGLWAAAPIFRPLKSLAQRLAATMALGCCIPLGLGLLDLLYWWSSWAVLCALLVTRVVRDANRASRNPEKGRPWDLLIGFAVLLALAWPIAVRPAMDGDTLIYHLPNAASWVVHHGLWTTGTRYWWYPPTSELFAAGLLATGGVGVVGWAGMLPAALLLLVVREGARRSGVPPLVGTLAACALLATPVVAVQLVSLQNDVWLTALFLFALTDYALENFAILALTKPYGIVFSLIASSTWGPARTRLVKAFLWASGALALWAVRDLILTPSAIVPIETTFVGNVARTTILGNLPASLASLWSASWHAGIVWVVLLGLGIASLFVANDRRLRWAAFVSIVVFAIVPTGYVGGSVRQLATGASLRFALPVAALGVLWLVCATKRWAIFVAAAAAIGTIGGIVEQWRLFSNDATTHDAPAIAIVSALIAAGALVIRDVRIRTAIAIGLCLCLGALAGGLARSHPADYVSDEYGSGFAYVSARHYERIVTLGLPAGAAVTLDPAASVFDGLDEGVCAQARALHAIVIASISKLPTARCGRIIYRDGATAVLDNGYARRADDKRG